MPMRLQCGHGVAAVENASGALPDRLLDGEASMRPRRRRRGELPCWQADRRAARRLQCGHGVAAVENAAPAGQKWADAVLQCGHGVAAVENARNCPTASYS